MHRVYTEFQPSAMPRPGPQVFVGWVDGGCRVFKHILVFSFSQAEQKLKQICAKLVKQLVVGR